MGRIENPNERSQEITPSRNTEQQSLEDVTVNPRESVEQTADYKEAEIIQTALTNLVENVSAEGDLEPETQLITATLQAAETIQQAIDSQGIPDMAADQVEVQAAPGQVNLVEVKEQAGEESGPRLVRGSEEVQPSEEVRKTTIPDAVRGPQPAIEEQEPELERSPLDPIAEEQAPEDGQLPQDSIDFEGEATEPGEVLEPESGDVGEQDEGEGPETIGEEEEVWTPPEYFLHQDNKGNMTVVDADGKTVENPPIIYTLDHLPEYAGKYFIAYPGSDPPVKHDGSLIDTSALIEIPLYIGPTEGFYLHQDNKGNMTVVDADGKTVENPPIIYTLDHFPGKYFIAYPGSDWPVKHDGSLIDPSALIERSLYNPLSAPQTPEED
jgi:hypothetical protein